MKIELSPKKIIPGAFTVWNQSGEADAVMELKSLTFRENSLDEIVSFHVLDHLFEEEIKTAMLNWRKCLKIGGKIFIVVDNYEYIARSLVGGDISIEELNANFAHPTNITQDNLLRYFTEAGFLEGSVTTWLESIKDGTGKIVIPKQHFELVYSSTKNE